MRPFRWHVAEIARRRSPPPFSEDSTPSDACTWIDSPGLVQALVISQAFDPTLSIEALLDAWFAVQEDESSDA